MPEERTYIAIDLKSFYASVECRERGLDPLTTNLVVADTERTEKTICLAVAPTLKAYGIPGRARLFEVIQKVKEINAARLQNAPGRRFTGSSTDAEALRADPALKLDFIAATPRMALYMQYSTKIYDIYLKYAAPEDIHVYSIDEVFIDATAYLRLNQMTPREFAAQVIRAVWAATGITATAGIGTNLYLSKVAMDIVAKHTEPDENGVRIAVLDELSYRKLLWTHRPLTDFWRVGKGYARKLEAVGLYTMGDVARCSIGKLGAYYNEELLYQLFGVNAELLIDHAWGYEPCGMKQIKAYRPVTNSLGTGQVLQCPYPAEKARLVVKEMADQLALDLVDKGLVTDQLILTIGYDITNLSDQKRKDQYKGAIVTDHYGRSVPKHAHGTANLTQQTCSAAKIVDAVIALYDKITDPGLLIRRVAIAANHIVPENEAKRQEAFEQLDLFTDHIALEQKRRQEQASLAREKEMQKAVLSIKRKFGKNAILKGMNLEDGATAKARNAQIGGHKA